MISMNQNRLMEKSAVSFLPLLILIVFCIHKAALAFQPEQSNQDSLLVNRAAQNIVAKVNNGTPSKVFVICSKSKQELAAEIIRVLEDKKIANIQLILDSQMESELVYFKKLITNLSEDWGLIFLMDTPHAPFLFSTVGRPDTGILIREDNLFCDWLASTETTVRVHSVDLNELHRFRKMLLDRVQNAKKIRITTQNGTDITISPRHWLKSDGEIWTAPIENSSNGQILIDGTAYWGPVQKQFLLHIENGRVINVDQLDIADKQQMNVKNDLSRNSNANVLAELGIGINSGALPDKDLMEAEQAKGTCHFGFGNNIMYGGENRSDYHFDLTILSPTIEVDGEIICKEGNYDF